jgi:hypothetical protein
MMPWLLMETRSWLTGMGVDQNPGGEGRDVLLASSESEQDSLVVTSCRHTAASPYLVADDGGKFAEDVLKYSSSKGISLLGHFPKSVKFTDGLILNAVELAPQGLYAE